MKSFSLQWSPADWQAAGHCTQLPDAQLILSFGPIESPPQSWFDEVRGQWPKARHIYCTGGGQIDRGEVVDAAVVFTAIEFEYTTTTVIEKCDAGLVPCEELGMQLGHEFAPIANLRHVLVFVDGLHVNGAAFTRGLNEALPAGVTVSGGLASDGTQFVSTGVGVDGPPQERRIVAVGLSGNSIRVGTGSAGGWLPFGPERTVTRASGTNIYELDGEPALSVYKRYLGELAADLPGSALLFPLALISAAADEKVVRTILGIDEALGALRFAGDVPQGSKVRLMRSTTDQLLDGASQAACAALTALGDVEPSVVLCISCIGRRAVLKSRVEEELEEVTRQTANAVVVGYYSNGEISPGSNNCSALLHNQTMTVTAIGEH